MEKKTVAIYALIIVLGLGIMVGVVLFLRARSAPGEPFLGGSNTTISPTLGPPGAKSYVQLETLPHVPPYKEGDPIPTSSGSYIETPDGAYFTP